MPSNVNATALTSAMNCDIAELRDAAVRIIQLELRACGGNLSRVAESLGVDRTTVHRWVTNHPVLRSTQLNAGGGRRGRPPTA